MSFLCACCVGSGHKKKASTFGWLPSHHLHLEGIGTKKCKFEIKLSLNEWCKWLDFKPNFHFAEEKQISWFCHGSSTSWTLSWNDRRSITYAKRRWAWGFYWLLAISFSTKFLQSTIFVWLDTSRKMKVIKKKKSIWKKAIKTQFTNLVKR